MFKRSQENLEEINLLIKKWKKLSLLDLEKIKSNREGKFQEYLRVIEMDCMGGVSRNRRPYHNVKLEKINGGGQK